MLIKDLNKCKEFIAGDKSILQELLNPDKENVKIHYSLAYAIIKPGQKTKLHSLKSAEVYYILSGEGIMYIESETAKVQAGQAVYIPPNLKQCIENTGKTDLKFLCIVDPAWKKEDEAIINEV